MDYETIAVGAEGPVGTLALPGRAGVRTACDSRTHTVHWLQVVLRRGPHPAFFGQALVSMRFQRASTWGRVVQVEPTEMRA